MKAQLTILLFQTERNGSGPVNSLYCNGMSAGVQEMASDKKQVWCCLSLLSGCPDTTHPIISIAPFPLLEDEILQDKVQAVQVCTVASPLLL